MNFSKFIFRCFFFLGIACQMATQLIAQNNLHLIDSLEKSLVNLKDSDLVITMNELTWQYRSVDIGKAIMYGNKAIELGTKINFEKGVAQGFNDLGILYYIKKEYPNALEAYSKALAIREKLGDKKGIAAIHSKIGILYQSKGDLEKALPEQIKALKLYEEIGFDHEKSLSFQNISILYFDIGNNQKSLEYSLKSVEIKKKLNDLEGLIVSYVSIANIYVKQKNYQGAILYFTNAFEQSKKIENEDYAAVALNNLATCYLELKNYSKALEFAKQSYTIRKATNDYNSIISSLSNMGQIYLHLHQPDEALKQLNEALDLSKKVEALPELPSLYQNLSNCYEQKNDFNKALSFQRMASLAKDSLVNEDLNSKITDMSAKYETEKKENENKLLVKQNAINSLEINRQKSQRNFLIVFFSLLLLLGLFFFNRNRLINKNKMLVEKDLRNKAIFMAQEEEKVRLSKELHDGLGPLLSLIKLNASGIQQNNDNEKIINEIKELASEGMKEVRTISHALMPALLQKNGLKDAVTSFVEQINTAKTLETKLNYNVVSTLQNKTEINIYRIIQEALNNIIKHSGATKASIELTEKENNLKLIITDNGKGFDVKETKNGNGLNNLVSRIEILKGSFKINSNSETGTKISIDIPLNEHTDV